MKKTRSFLFTASLLLATALTLPSCSTLQKSNDLRTAELIPKAQAFPMVADLEVADKKVLGQAQGKTVSKRDLEQEAIAEAIEQANADVLVGTSYFYEQRGSNLMVTVVGYPARYKNFRPKEVPQADVLVGGDFFYKDGSNDLSVTVKNIRPEAQQKPQETTQSPAPAPLPIPTPVPLPIPTPVQTEGNAQ